MKTKVTHTIFIQKLLLKNKAYKNNEFILLSKYKNKKNKTNN